MKLKPSERPKKRYIAFEVVSNKLNNDSIIYNTIVRSAANAFGENYKEAGIRFLKDKYKPSLHRGIIRVNNRYAKSLVGEINKNKDIKTIGMSGILRVAEKKYLKIASWYLLFLIIN